MPAAKVLLRLLLYTLPLTAAAQVQPGDTAAAVKQLFGSDSSDLTRLVDLAGRVDAVAYPDSAGNIYTLAGMRYHDHSLPAHELRYLLMAARLAEKSGDQERTAWRYNDLGSFYKNQGNYRQALTWLLPALSIFRKLGHHHGLGSVYNSLGDVYERQARYAQALTHYTLALQELKDARVPGSSAWPTFNIGEVHMLQGHYDSAFIYYSMALALQQATGQKSGEGWTCNNIGGTLIRLRRYNEAERYCISALAIADSMNEAVARMHAHSNLAIIYEAMGRYRQALQHHKAFAALQASAGNEENTRNIVKHQMQYEFDRQQEQDQQAQDKKDRKYIFIGIALLAGIAAAVAGMYAQRRSSRLRAALLLQQAETLGQKETMMKEIHHRVRNNLQVTSVLLNLQLAHVTDAHAKEVITGGISRIDTIALIHTQLYHKESTGSILFTLFADTLYQQLHQLYGTPARQITFTNRLPQFLLDMDTAVPLGLILNELITNSYKYAFTGGSHHFIDLSLEQNGGSYTLRYADSGPGIGDRKTQKGLGLTIIDQLVRQIGGHFSPVAGSGIFIVTFRDAAEMKKMA